MKLHIYKHTFLPYLLFSLPDQKYWIGLVKDDTSYSWLDGEDLGSWAPWSTSIDNKDCIYWEKSDHGYLFSSKDCSDSLSFLCQWEYLITGT